MSKRKSKIVERKIEYLIERDERSRALWFVAFVMSVMFWILIGLIAIISFGNQHLMDGTGTFSIFEFSCCLILYSILAGALGLVWIDSVFSMMIEKYERIRIGLTLEVNPWTGEYLDE